MQLPPPLLLLLVSCPHFLLFLAALQLMFMFTPLGVAIASSLLLRQPGAPGVYLTLIIAIGGSAMVIAGKWL
jgi:hypothetical protein